LYQKETSFSAKKLQSDYLSNPISALQSDMVVRWILGFDDVLDGCMLTYDSAEMKFNKIVLAKKQDCPVC